MNLLRNPAFAARKPWLYLVLAVACACLLAMLLPHAIVQNLNWVGYAVCHQIGERSFTVGGSQLPLCARDTGMFGSVLLCSITLAGLQRVPAARFPQIKFIPVLMLFAASWALDGFNSYALLLTRSTLWYLPQNPMRLFTGALMGIGIACVIVPFINQIIWHPSVRAEQPVLSRWRDLGVLLAVALGWVALVLWQPGVLYGPYTLLSTLGTLFMLTTVNTLTILLIRRRDQLVHHWRAILWPIVIGGVVCVLQIAAIGLLRMSLTQRFGLPY